MKISDIIKRIVQAFEDSNYPYPYLAGARRIGEVKLKSEFLIWRLTGVDAPQSTLDGAGNPFLLYIELLGYAKSPDKAAFVTEEAKEALSTVFHVNEIDNNFIFHDDATGYEFTKTISLKRR